MPVNNITLKYELENWEGIHKGWISNKEKDIVPRSTQEQSEGLSGGGDQKENLPQNPLKTSVAISLGSTSLLLQQAFRVLDRIFWYDDDDAISVCTCRFVVLLMLYILWGI